MQSSIESFESANSSETIARAVLEQYDWLPKAGKPQPNEHTVLAGFVITEHESLPRPIEKARSPAASSDGALGDTEHMLQRHVSGATHARQPTGMYVVSIGTGTKCLAASKRTEAGDVIHDSHAEVCPLGQRVCTHFFYVFCFFPVCLPLTGKCLTCTACSVLIMC